MKKENNINNGDWLIWVYLEVKIKNDCLIQK